MKKILITGIAGFVGSHLLDYLLRDDNKYEIYGIERENSSLERISYNLTNIKLFFCDLVDSSAVGDTIKNIKPDYIYHLAGVSSVKDSWGSIFSIVNNNISATLNIFEALKLYKLFGCKILLTCSSDEYGVVDKKDIPINEDTILKPVSPYAVSKGAVDMFAFQYYSNYGLKIIRIRAFNHTGPRRPEIYALSGFAKQIVEIEKGMIVPRIKVGNLNVVRDYTDVRDIVRGYVLAMEYCKPGDVYNLCSSRGYKLADLLDILISFSNKDIEIVKDKARMRLTDLPIIIGNNSKFRNIVPWEPKFNIDKTLKDILDYWRSKN